jgi:hypothetical protein
LREVANDPLVCAIMLTRDRPEMAARAVRSFREQTYRNRVLAVLDTGNDPCGTDEWLLEDMMTWSLQPSHNEDIRGLARRKSIGALRNEVCDWAAHGPTPIPEIFITWDDDDWSHAARIAEQVALLQSSGAACVGYSQALFWDTVTPPAGQAWIYSGNPIGASFCYWRETWEALPFEDVSRGEDDRFWRALRVAGKKVETFSGLVAPSLADNDYPRMIHHIHGGNTWVPDYAKAAAHGSNNWRRAPEFDEYCRERMALVA